MAKTKTISTKNLVSWTGALWSCSGLYNPIPKPGYVIAYTGKNGEGDCKLYGPGEHKPSGAMKRRISSFRLAEDTILVIHAVDKKGNVLVDRTWGPYRKQRNKRRDIPFVGDGYNNNIVSLRVTKD